VAQVRERVTAELESAVKATMMDSFARKEGLAG
jgi:hypothetical protein